ncbi:MAG: hypothetical protein ACRDID_21680 [Ktedonobacterales bacterium]
MEAEVDAARQALRTPRAAAISGIVFSLLLSVSLILIRVVIPSTPRGAGVWLSNSRLTTAVLVALTLVPFAGIAFLWFIGVVRDRMGQREDRLFASVFLGSGLLFVAMLFFATALGAGLVSSFASASGPVVAPDTWRLGRAVAYSLMTTYAMRMAAVFMISTASIAVRIAIMPRWIAILGFASALVLLISVGYLAWVELLFPAWVLLVSIYILIATHSGSAEERHASAVV